MEHYDRERIIPVGPRAQAILAAYIDIAPSPDSFLFNPQVAAKKGVPMMTLEQVRECLSGILVEERLQSCSQDDYICYRCAQWLNRTKLAIEYCKNKKINVAKR